MLIPFSMHRFNGIDDEWLVFRKVPPENVNVVDLSLAIPQEDFVVAVSSGSSAGRDTNRGRKCPASWK